jgi:DNA-directed RNA polymerase specialized sigma24 family protein
VGLARRLGATDEQAADVVQEVHLRLWRELSSGTVVDDVDGWTFRVAYRLVMDHHRLGRRVRDLVGRLTDVRPKAADIAVDDALSLWPVVDRLPGTRTGRALPALSIRSLVRADRRGHGDHDGVGEDLREPGDRTAARPAR